MSIRKYIIATGLLICFYISGFSQSAKQFHFDVGFLQNHGGFFKLYDGIIEVGGDYSISLTRDLFAGIGLHGGFLNRNNAGAHAIFYKPALKLSYVVHITERIAVAPCASLGFAWLWIRNDGFGYKDSQSGLNTGFDLRFIWKTKERTDFYIFGRYNYIHLNEDRTFTELDFYRRINQTSFGIGITLK